MAETRQLELASEPGTWQLALFDGSSLNVTAHSYSEEHGSYIFSLLLKGQPYFEIDVLQIPSNLVSKIRSD